MSDKKSNPNFAKHAVSVGMAHGKVDGPTGMCLSETEFTTYVVSLKPEHYNAIETEAAITQDANPTPEVGNVSIFRRVGPNHVVHVSVWKVDE